MLREDEEAKSRAAERAALRKEKDDKAHQERYQKEVWKARSRYMESAEQAAQRAIKPAARAVCPFCWPVSDATSAILVLKL